MHKKSRLLVISKVYPFPGESGQQMRVRYSLESLRNDFHITFFSTSPKSQIEVVKKEISKYVDESIIIPTKFDGIIIKTIYRIIGLIWMILTGLKFSNFIVSKIDFTTKRLESELAGKEYDIVLYEYWHSYKTIEYFIKKNVPTILDMHNILWQSYKSQLDLKSWIPGVCKERLVNRYKRYEESAWTLFNGLIAINKKEFCYVNDVTHNQKNNIYIPMGIDLSKWSVERAPAQPPRIGYYGGLGSSHNQRDALKCYKDIMPLVWEEYSDAELWLIGSNPPNHLKELNKHDSRIHVTGYVRNVAEILKTMTVMVLPWEGTYGFRSRMIEMMALGLPIVTTEQAIDGMNISENTGLIISENNNQFVKGIDKIVKFSKKESVDLTKQIKKAVASYNYKVIYNQMNCFIQKSI